MKKREVTKKIVPIAMSVLMALTCTQGVAFAEPAEGGQDIAALKQAVEKAEQEMRTAEAEMNEAEGNIQPLKEALEAKEQALKDAENALTQAQNQETDAKNDRDNAFKNKKAEAQKAYDDAVAAFTEAEQAYNNAVSAVTTKTEELQAAEGEKTQIENDLATLNEEKDAAQQQVDSLPAQIQEAQQTVTAAQTAWQQDKDAAAQAVTEAQAACDTAGRNFINQKINDNNGSDLDEMIAACKTYTDTKIDPITDSAGNTYSTVADIANSANFEKVVDRGCTYENLKKNIEYIREANAHRRLPIHNAGDLKVSYQLMGTAIVSSAVCVYQTGHNFCEGSDWDFWPSGNSTTMGENLAYSPVPSGQWDPFHGWYYKERMRFLANERGVTLDQNLVDEVLAESSANGYPYNPYGPPWNQSKSYFLSRITNVTGHYTGLINSKFKATGFSYIDGIDYEVSSYPYVASQEFNGDTSKSVTVDQYEQELDAWFAEYLSALQQAQANQQALETKPENLVTAEQTLQEKQQALADAQQTVADKESAISNKQTALTNAETKIETKTRELAAAETDKATKENAKDQAQREKETAEAANNKAKKLDAEDSSTYEDFEDLQGLVETYNKAKADAAEKEELKNTAVSQRDAAQAAYEAAEPAFQEKKVAYEAAKTKYDEAVAALDAATNLTKATITVANATYSGNAQKPAPTVVLNGTTLVQDQDYTAAYKNNTNAGTATVTVTGKGDYKESKSQTFKISARKITPAVTLSTSKYVYNGKAKTPAVTVKYGTTTLKKTTDYTVAYPAGRIKVGSYTVKVTLKGNYIGTATKSFTINKATNPMIAKGKTATLKYKTLKRKNQVVTAKNAFSVTKNQGKVTYKKTSGNAKITVTSAGKVTVKKKIKKGTYKVKVKVTAAGNSNYKSKYQTVTLTIKVK